MKKLKYIKYECIFSDKFIIFDESENHSSFKGFQPKNAGFVYLSEDENKQLKAQCFGYSKSLGLKSDPEDSELLTKELHDFNSF